MKYCKTLILWLIIFSISIIIVKAQETTTITYGINDGAKELKELEADQAEIQEIDQVIQSKDYSKAEILIKRYDEQFGHVWKSQICFYSRIKLGDAYRNNGDKRSALRAYKEATPGI